MQREATLNKLDIWQAGFDAMNAFGPHYQRAMGGAITDAGLNNGFFALTLARGADPDPFTVSRYHDLAPYTNPDTLATVLDSLATRGFLADKGDKTYKVTAQGSTAVMRPFSVAHVEIGRLTPLAEGDLERLAGYLERIVQATLAAPEPAEKWALLYSRWTDPGANAAVCARIDQYLTDLSRFRDDAHIAAFKPLGVSGHAWEALTFVWREEADTAEALHKSQSFRGYDVEAYRAALNTLVERGWLAETEGRYTITDEGRRVREAAEEATDHYFFAGWQALTEDEIHDMNDLLVRLRDSVHRQTSTVAYNLVGEASGFLYQFYADPRAQAAREAGLPEPGAWLVLYHALCAEPEGLTLDYLRERGPYTADSIYAQRLSQGVETGNLSATDKGQYRLTRQGREAIGKIFGVIYAAFDEVETLTDEQVDQLERLLHRLVDAILEQDGPTDRFDIAHTCKIDPGTGTNKLAHIDQRLDEVFAYRDDAHKAAWKPHGVSGYEWEVFSYVWQGDVATALAAAEQLQGTRGYSGEDYGKALRQLAQRGWLVEKDGHFTLTETGRRVREEAETATDDCFYAPWSVFSITELNQLYNLLYNLNQALKAAVETQIAAARKDLYPTFDAMPGKLYGFMQNETTAAIQAAGLNGTGLLAALQIAQLFVAEPATETTIRLRYPYGAEGLWESRFKELVAKGYVKTVDGGYRITGTGQQALAAVNRVFYAGLDHTGAKLTTNIARLVELLEKVVNACIETPAPPDATWLRLYHQSHPGPDASLMTRLDYAYDELNAFRDDAHNAAWQPQKVSGAAWETLTLAWREGVATPAEMLEKRPGRGHNEAAFKQAFTELAARGWIAEADGSYTVTDEGRRLREQVEALTERYFYAPWAVLDSNEVAELRQLLNGFIAELDALVAQQSPA